MALKKFVAAGARYSFFGTTDADGVLKGSTTTAPATGNQVGSGLLRLTGIKSAAAGVPEQDIVPVTGDDGTLGSFQFDPELPPNFVATYGQFDMDATALFQGSNTQTIGGGTIGLVQPNDPSDIDGCLLIQGKAVDKETNQTGYHGFLFPSAVGKPLSRESFTEKEAADNRISVVTQIATKHPWGVTMTIGNEGKTGAPIVEFFFPNPITMHRFTGDGSETDFTLEQTPISASDMAIYVDGGLLTAGADYTVNASTRVITFGSAPANGARIVVVYQFSG